ncbi:hypothetical protein [Acidiphilium sp. PM]|uniref:hypothetical protein n=1 Tax=Acidiphilium sp. PM TaxID=1043206 RepID=UPI0002145153|nr:hypothetical protein [Acidiphilium sp. PM]EGO94282.1 Hypothetical protein APM_2931 [Acidiphilium sp. PM]
MARTKTIKLGADKRFVSPDKKIGLETLSKAPETDQIEKMFDDVIPAGMSDEDRKKFVKGLAIGVQVMRLDNGGLADRLEKSHRQLAKQRGQDDPKIDRLAALKFAREIRNEAIEAGKLLDGMENDQIDRKYGAAVRVAKKHLGWNDRDVRAATVDLIVQFNGDKTKAAQSFVEIVKSDRRFEAGHMKNSSLDQVDENGQTIETKIGVTSHGFEQQQELKEREEREAKLDGKLAKADKIAAALLTDKEYTAYRLIRDNAHLIHFDRSEITMSGDERDNTPGKLIADKMSVSLRQGREYAKSVLEKVSASKDSIKITLSQDSSSLSKLNAKIQTRIGTPTEKLVEKHRNNTSPEQIEESRNRERMKTRERAARLHAAKKARREAGISL